jgi:hypothetical protein
MEGDNRPDEREYPRPPPPGEDGDAAFMIHQVWLIMEQAAHEYSDRDHERWSIHSIYSFRWRL